MSINLVKHSLKAFVLTGLVSWHAQAQDICQHMPELMTEFNRVQDSTVYDGREFSAVSQKLMDGLQQTFNEAIGEAGVSVIDFLDEMLYQALEIPNFKNLAAETQEAMYSVDAEYGVSEYFGGKMRFITPDGSVHEQMSTEFVKQLGAGNRKVSPLVNDIFKDIRDQNKKSIQEKVSELLSKGVRSRSEEVLPYYVDRKETPLHSSARRAFNMRRRGAVIISGGNEFGVRVMHTEPLSLGRRALSLISEQQPPLKTLVHEISIRWNGMNETSQGVDVNPRDHIEACFVSNHRNGTSWIWKVCQSYDFYSQAVYTHVYRHQPERPLHNFLNNRSTTSGGRMVHKQLSYPSFVRFAASEKNVSAEEIKACL